MISLFNPQALLFGGGVILSNPEFFDKVRVHAEAAVINQCSTKVDIGLVSLKENAAVMGALSLVLNNVLELDFNVPED